MPMIRMKRFLLWILMLAGLLQAGWAGASRPVPTFRIHLQITGEGLPANQATVVQLLNPPQQITVNSLPEISEKDIASVEESSGAEGYGILVHFNKHGANVLSSFTAANQGKIMVIFLNGRVIYAPTIDVAINSGQILLPHDVTPDDFKLFQEMIRQNQR